MLVVPRCGRVSHKCLSLFLSADQPGKGIGRAVKGMKRKKKKKKKSEGRSKLGGEEGQDKSRRGKVKGK